MVRFIRVKIEGGAGVPNVPSTSLPPWKIRTRNRAVSKDSVPY